jgi:hypothetical protein
MKFKVNCKKKKNEKKRQTKLFQEQRKKNLGKQGDLILTFFFFLLIEQIKLNYREVVITEWLVYICICDERIRGW